MAGDMGSVPGEDDVLDPDRDSQPMSPAQAKSYQDELKATPPTRPGSAATPPIDLVPEGGPALSPEDTGYVGTPSSGPSRADEGTARTPDTRGVPGGFVGAALRAFEHVGRWFLLVVTLGRLRGDGPDEDADDEDRLVPGLVALGVLLTVIAVALVAIGAAGGGGGGNGRHERAADTTPTEASVKPIVGFVVPQVVSSPPSCLFELVYHVTVDGEANVGKHGVLHITGGDTVDLPFVVGPDGTADVPFKGAHATPTSNGCTLTDSETAEVDGKPLSAPATTPTS